jgi:ribonuclease R
MGAQDKLLANFKNGKLSGLSLREICKKLSVPRGEIKTVSKVLDTLCKDGTLCHDEHRRYYTPEQLGAVTGTIAASKGGYAFLVPDDRAKYPADFFIPGRKLHGALHGDKVMAIPSRYGASGDEVAVIRILERGYTEIVGTFFRRKYGQGVYPDEEKYAENISIPRGKEGGAQDGMKVVAKITSYPAGKEPIGEVIEVLGDGEDFFVEELSLIRAHGLREEFPENVKKAAKKAPSSVPEKDLQGRSDLRDKLIVTVDGEDTRDIDDAISVERAGDDYILGVHIADVTNYVEYEGILDKEAFARGTSVYFPDRVLPMLPKELSNGICSLNEGVDRLTLSCIMRIDSRGKVKKADIQKSVIRSTHRMTYHAVEDIANGKEEALEKYPDLIDFVKDAFDLTKILKDARRKRGEVELDVKEAKITIDEKGNISVPDYERLFSQEMIEQFMVLANESVATFMTEKKAPFVYRIHEKPKAEKAEELQAFLISLGISAPFDPENVKPQDYRDILESAKGDGAYSIINRVMLRSMMKAKYDSVNVGHFGLSSDCYCHFTSPIRRYPDLCIHRIIKMVIDGKEAEAKAMYAPFVSEASVRSSDCEKKAMEAERDVDDLYKTMYMSDHIGEEFDGVISGVTNFGVFVELANTIEGLIPYAQLPKDDYEFFENRFLLRGKEYSFRIGEELRIKVAGCDFGNRKTEFSFVSKFPKKA